MQYIQFHGWINLDSPASSSHLLVIALNCMEFAAHREVVACGDGSQQQSVVILEMPKTACLYIQRGREEVQSKKTPDTSRFKMIQIGRNIIRVLAQFHSSQDDHSHVATWHNRLLMLLVSFSGKMRLSSDSATHHRVAAPPWLYWYQLVSLCANHAHFIDIVGRSVGLSTFW